MRELNIACGQSANALKWKNGLITWEDLCSRLRRTVRTRETVEQYHAMSREERDRAKDEREEAKARPKLPI